MWATVPFMPEVTTVPVTVGQLLELPADGHFDSPTEMSVVPEAEVVTAGTSWLPLSGIGPLLVWAIPAQPATRTAAAQTPNQRDRLMSI
jgi:hypothetical protein